MKVIELPKREEETKVDAMLVSTLENALERVKSGEITEALLVCHMPGRYEFTIPPDHAIAMLMLENARMALMKAEGW